MDWDGLAGDVSRGESPSFSTPSCVRALFQGLGCGRRRAGHALVLVCSFTASASLVAGEHQEGHWRECEGLGRLQRPLASSSCLRPRSL